MTALIKAYRVMKTMENNILNVRDRAQFREWLENHHDSETECWAEVRHGKPTEPDVFYYLDAVEEADYMKGGKTMIVLACATGAICIWGIVVVAIRA